jgi:hypothetical protein
VTKAADSGIHVTGSHDIVEQCIVHDCQDTGILIATAQTGTPAVTIPDSGSYNTILNCDSYHNNDTATNGANADGFGAKKPDTGADGAGNVFDGCRSWDNADDGFDFFGWISPVEVKNSWAFNMGGTTAGGGSNGNGFKMGSAGLNVKHIMSNVFAFNNTGNGGHKSDKGFDSNNNTASMSCSPCAGWNNAGGNGAITISGSSVTGKASAAAVAAKRKADGSLPDISTL